MSEQESQDDAIARFNAERAAVKEPESNPATPQLKARIRMEVTIEQDINLLAYFQGLSEFKQKRYADTSTDGGYAEWERPLAYLLGDDNDDDLDISLLPWMPGATWHETVDVTESELRVRYRTGSANAFYGMDAEWSEEDFNTLRANVPWLDRVHSALETEDDEERAEELARIPGPLDTPLDLETP